jgi:hypothetical protein
MRRALVRETSSPKTVDVSPRVVSVSKRVNTCS